MTDGPHTEGRAGAHCGRHRFTLRVYLFLFLDVYFLYCSVCSVMQATGIEFMALFLNTLNLIEFDRI